jgi:hypothetical protein
MTVFYIPDAFPSPRHLFKAADIKPGEQCIPTTPRSAVPRSEAAPLDRAQGEDHWQDEGGEG